MDPNIKNPPGSPLRSSGRNSKNGTSIQLNFKNDTGSDLTIATYVQSLQKVIIFPLSKGRTHCSTLKKTTKNYWLSLSKNGQALENIPVICSLYSNFLDNEKKVQEKICVNTDTIFLYYEFLQDPVTINTTISLQRIWAHAEQA